MPHRLLAILIASLAPLGLASPVSVTAAEPIWRLLAGGGHLGLMRHALAPGIDDPAGFRLGDSSTRRNLDAEGRAQAQAIGRRFRDQGIEVVGRMG